MTDPLPSDVRLLIAAGWTRHGPDDGEPLWTRPEGGELISQASATCRLLGEMGWQPKPYWWHSRTGAAPSFAVACDSAREQIEQLRDHGKAPRSWQGAQRHGDAAELQVGSAVRVAAELTHEGYTPNGAAARQVLAGCAGSIVDRRASPPGSWGQPGTVVYKVRELDPMGRVAWFAPRELTHNHGDAASPPAPGADPPGEPEPAEELYQAGLAWIRDTSPGYPDSYRHPSEERLCEAIEAVTATAAALEPAEGDSDPAVRLRQIAADIGELSGTFATDNASCPIMELARAVQAVAVELEQRERIDSRRSASEHNARQDVIAAAMAWTGVVYREDLGTRGRALYDAVASYWGQ